MTFTGRRLDAETGLYYFRARYYSADLGRFIGRDPLGYINGLSLYAGYYVPNGLDPLGLSLWDLMTTGEWNPSLAMRAGANQSLASGTGVGAVLTGAAHVVTEVAGTLADAGRIYGQTVGQNLLAASTLGQYGQFGRMDAEDLRGTNVGSFYGGVASATSAGTYDGKAAVTAAADMFSRANPVTGIPLALYDAANSNGTYHTSENLTAGTLAALPLLGVKGLGADRVPFRAAPKSATTACPAEAAKSGPIDVTPETIGKALEDSNMKTAQDSVSQPAIERYVRMLEDGQEAPPIKTDGDVIVDGNHRFIAGELVGKPVSMEPGTLAPSQGVKVKPIQAIKVDPVDWGNH